MLSWRVFFLSTLISFHRRSKEEEVALNSLKRAKCTDPNITCDVRHCEHVPFHVNKYHSQTNYMLYKFGGATAFSTALNCRKNITNRKGRRYSGVTQRGWNFLSSSFVDAPSTNGCMHLSNPPQRPLLHFIITSQHVVWRRGNTRCIVCLSVGW